MRLKGIEKQFWWNFGQIKDSKDIPEEVSGVSGVDDPEYNDDYFAMLTEKVKIMHSIYLKETHITDEGVKHISKLQGLKSLTLMKHPKITKVSLPYLNKLVDLEYLDIWDTGILLEDLVALDQLKNLKEVYISSARKIEDELDNDDVLEQLIVLEDLFSNCVFWVDFKKY
ncbi:hypothetical protein [Flavobacterium sp. 245]|uniref:hypothetical protein n=1 Tax=Flavobacterium sp. 245 TaxID=2512115 RepID=UPI00105C2862|nr:hypothetical protein [Flavobacterium sp. 245]TDP00713.1 hypothetical protein EV145_10592 [Flavobacterium sp. 245]